MSILTISYIIRSSFFIIFNFLSFGTNVLTALSIPSFIAAFVRSEILTDIPYSSNMNVRFLTSSVCTMSEIATVFDILTYLTIYRHISHIFFSIIFITLFTQAEITPIVSRKSYNISLKYRLVILQQTTHNYINFTIAEMLRYR